MYHIVGISKRLTGTYQGKPWANYRIFCMDPSNQNMADGTWIESVKVPDRIGVSGLAVGDSINIYYNRFGQVESIQKVEKK